MKKKDIRKRFAAALMAAVIGTGSLPLYMLAGAEDTEIERTFYEVEETEMTYAKDEIDDQINEESNPTGFEQEEQEEAKEGAYDVSAQVSEESAPADIPVQKTENVYDMNDSLDEEESGYEADGGEDAFREEDAETGGETEDDAHEISVLSARCDEMTLTLKLENTDAFPEGIQLYLLSVKDALKYYGDPDSNEAAWRERLQKSWQDREETTLDPLLAYYVLVIDEEGSEVSLDHVKYEFSLENQDFAKSYEEDAQSCLIGYHEANEQYALSNALRDNRVIPWEDGKGISFCGITDRFGWYSFARKDSAMMIEETAEAALAAETAYLASETADEQMDLAEEAELAALSDEENTDEEIEDVNEDPVPDKFKLVIKGVSTAPGALMNGNATTTNKTITFYESDGSTTSQIAYCLQPKALSPSSGHAYEKEDTQILNNGSASEMALAKGMFYLYGGPAWGQTVSYADHSGSVNLQNEMTEAGCKTTAHYYAMTHYILSYIYMNGSNWNYNGSDSNVINSKGTALIKTIAEQLGKMPMPKAELSAQKVQASYSKEKQLNVSESVTYQTFHDNIARIVLPEGVYLVNETTGARAGGTVVINGGDTFHLEASGTITGLKSYTLTSSFSNDFTAMKLQLSGRQDIGFSYVSGDYDMQFKVDWPKMVRIGIQKQDALRKENRPSASSLKLADAVYGIYKDAACTQLVKEIRTDASGYALSDFLPIDQYYVKESKAPTGYLLSEEVLRITQDEMAAGLATDLTVKRQMADMPIRGGLVLMKYLDKNMSSSQLQDLYESGELEGIEFELQHEDSTVPAVTITTDRQGYAATGEHALLYGTWNITEKNAPEGYSGLTSAHVTIRQDGVMEKYVVSNSQITQFVKIIKKDAANGKTIKKPGTVFSILDESGNAMPMPDNADFAKTVTEFRTNSDGELMLTQPLSAGSYTLKEVNGPKGFAITDPIPFTVTEDASYEQPRELYCEDQPLTGSLSITKVDEQGNRLGEGFVFRVSVAEDITDEDGELRTMVIGDEEITLAAGTVIGEIVTDVQGIASMNHLYLGIYEITECGSAQYYAIDPTSYRVILREPENQENGQQEPIIADIRIENRKTEVNILKVDAVETEKPLEGVHYRVISADQLKDVKDVQGDEKDEGGAEGSTDEGRAEDAGTEGENSDMESGTHTENTADIGNANDIENTVDTGNVNDIENTVDTGNVNDIENTIDMESIRSSSVGNEYVTDENGQIQITDLTHRTTYYVYETETLPGYHLDTEIYRFYVDADGLVNGRPVYDMKFSNVANMVEISKKDITGDAELPGAELVVSDMSGTEIDRWISQDEPHKMKGLTAGEYRLTENRAPLGYATAETITFALSDSMQVQQVTMYDRPLEVSVSKKDITNGRELPGAKLTIKDHNGTVIEEWISTEEPHMLQLPAGNYTLTEIAAPERYATAETIAFTVNDEMKVQKVEMLDKPLQVSISKRDITTEKELPGATLIIKDTEGKEVETWVSKDTPHMVQLAKGNYTLTEITAPKGYRTAETISFTVKDSMEVQQVVMYDKAIEEKEKESDAASHDSNMPGGQVGKTGIQDHFRVFVAIIAVCMLVGGISFLIYLFLGKDA